MLYVIRHGQTDWNVLNKVQGQADIPLNEKGLEQADTLKLNLQTLSFTTVVSSPLLRAQETAKIICDSKFPLLLDNRMIERNFGEFEGLSKTDFDILSFWNYEKNVHYKKAENIQDFLTRVYDFLDEYKPIYEANNVLLVTHAGVIPAICSYFKGIPNDNNIFTYQCENCEILEFQ